MTPARIMIVEDEKITAEDIQDLLVEWGYGVTGIASTGAAALQQAELAKPDLVLMDIRIKGDMDGIDTARALREQFDIPVLYLTAHADADTLFRAKLAEPLGYIVKPFQELDLQASIEMALHKQAVDRGRRDREHRLYNTLKSLEEGVITVDRDSKIVYMNSAAEKWTGWTLTQAAGKEIEGIFQLRGSLPATEVLCRALREGVITELNEVLVSRYGSENVVEGSGAPIRDHLGAPTGAVVLFAQLSKGGEDPKQEAGALNLVVESEAMTQVFNFAKRVARSEVSTVLIEGESGTGKDILAKYIHHQSSRHAEPFLAINCASIPETLLESELFGFEKGAFTDARAQKKGMLELAGGGTLFLDEIAEMPLPLQAKLLRFLEEYTFRRLGGTQSIKVDLRVIVATNQNLVTAIERSKFRLDLFYRLNVIHISVPPLRARPEDIMPLAKHFVRVYNQRFNRDLKGFSPSATKSLLTHTWPGNVRELRNCIERAIVLEESAWITSESLRLDTRHTSGTEFPGRSSSSLQEVEKAMLIQALETSKWNQTHAAKWLGISRDTLRYRMKKFDVKSSSKND